MENMNCQVAALAIGIACWSEAELLMASQAESGSVSAVEAKATEPDASIFVIGGDDTQALERLIRDLLAQHSLRADFSRAADLDVAQLFEDSSGDQSVQVFIEARPDRREVRLYFRGPFGKRYLLRTIPLSTGFSFTISGEAVPGETRCALSLQ